MSFLTGTSFSAFVTEHQARLFYTQIRCGLLHQSEAEGSLIKRNDTDPLISTTKNNKGVIVNAKAFHAQLEKVVNEYADVLRKPGSSEQRAAFRKKMNFICAVGESGPANISSVSVSYGSLK